jgi:uncharacterized membrane protein YfcA
MNETLAIMLVALILGLAKGGFGGIGALLVPLLSTVMPVSEAVGLMLPLLMVGDAFALRAYWRQWDARHLRLLLPGAVIGIVIGLLLLTSLSDDALRRILGTFTLVIAVYKVASDALKKVEYAPHNWHGALAGSVSGFSSALANAGGPPITAYLLLQKLQPTVFVGTNVLFFAIVNALKLPAFLAAEVTDVHRLSEIVWVVPLIPLGVWLGRHLIDRINRRLFEALMLLSLLWAGFSLLLG